VSEIDRLAAGQYLLLTTIKRDGTPLPTAVWVARDDDSLYVVTPLETGKVKRLRHTERVLLAPCDMRGRPTGPEIEGTARLLDAEGTTKARRLIDAKYGLMSKVMGFLDVAVRNRGKPTERIGVEISVHEPSDG
jgi:PPOX class probable F420-dependent enzyme